MPKLKKIGFLSYKMSVWHIQQYMCISCFSINSLKWYHDMYFTYAMFTKTTFWDGNKTWKYSTFQVSLARIKYTAISGLSKTKFYCFFVMSIFQYKTQSQAIKNIHFPHVYVRFGVFFIYFSLKKLFPFFLLLRIPVLENTKEVGDNRTDWRIEYIDL